MNEVGEVTIPGDVINDDEMLLPNAESTDLLASLLWMAAEKCKGKKASIKATKMPAGFC
jgi:hypothetical protein